MAHTGGNSILPDSNLSRRESGIWDSLNNCQNSKVVDITTITESYKLKSKDILHTCASQSSFLNFRTLGRSASEVSPGARASDSSNLSMTEKVDIKNEHSHHLNEHISNKPHIEEKSVELLQGANDCLAQGKTFDRQLRTYYCQVKSALLKRAKQNSWRGL